MTTMKSAAAAVAKRLTNLDTASTEAKMQELAETRARIDAARQAGERERNEARQAVERRKEGADPSLAADALLAGQDVLEAVETVELLTARADAIVAGLTGLRERDEAARNEVAALQGAIVNDLAEAAGPLADHLEAEVARLVGELAQAYTDISVVAEATCAGRMAQLRTDLAEPLFRLGVSTRIKVDRTARSPSPDVVEALKAGSTAITLARRGVPAAVPYPN